jgi:hypothetical protein
MNVIDANGVIRHPRFGASNGAAIDAAIHRVDRESEEERDAFERRRPGVTGFPAWSSRRAPLNCLGPDVARP